MCKEAAKQGELGPTHFNCLITTDGCSAWKERNRVHCNGRAGLWHTNSFTMVERDVEDADFCPKLLTGIMFRDPVAGALSTLRNEMFHKEKLMQVLQNSTRSGLDAERVPHGPCLPYWDGYEHFDNFATRSLGGAYMAPPRGVTKEHFQRAKARLKSIDVVMVLEELEEHLPQLEHVLGWNTSLMTPSQPANVHCGKGLINFTKEEQDFLATLNKWDYKLYRVAQQEAARRTKVALQQLATDA
mmetsp:Transcript_5315/g.11730  ORF Transcript_5315/g.11730 Transcript_5315/m.11730 type:complete len:243 (-) Transcript_5315:6-734(-)